MFSMLERTGVPIRMDMTVDEYRELIRLDNEVYKDDKLIMDQDKKYDTHLKERIKHTEKNNNVVSSSPSFGRIPNFKHSPSIVNIMDFKGSPSGANIQEFKTSGKKMVK